MKALGRFQQPMITLRAKSDVALHNATAKKVAVLREVSGSHPVLVVYGDKAASLYCEPAASVLREGRLPR